MTGVPHIPKLKNTMNTKIALVALATFLLISHSDAQSPKANLLPGTWKVMGLIAAFPDNASPDQITKGKKIIADDEKNFKKTTFDFTPDGKLTVGKKKFVWVMDADGSHVTVQRKKKPKIVATILELSDHRLVFTRPDDGMIVTYTLSR